LASDDWGPPPRQWIATAGKAVRQASAGLASSRLQEGAMNSLTVAEVRPLLGTPIDLVEEFVIANDWAHDRASEDELIVEIS
jgi:hypothetical protein